MKKEKSQKSQAEKRSSIVKPLKCELTVGDNLAQAPAPVGNRSSSVVKPAKQGLTLRSGLQPQAPSPTCGLGEQRNLMDLRTVVSGPVLDPELVIGDSNRLLPTVRKSDCNTTKPDRVMIDQMKNLYA